MSPSGTANYTHDAANQLTVSSGPGGTTNLSYDSNGNRTLTQPPSGAPTTFTWDVADRLSVNKLANGKVVTHTYRYDDLRWGRAGQAGTDGQMWDGDALITWSRKDGAGSTANQPAQAFTGPADGPELGRALGTQTGTGIVGVERQYHTDEQGTVLAISDDSQAAAVTYQTDAWGTVQSGSLTDQPLDYAGGLGYQRDPDSGLEYVRARHYDPATGEWLNQDPIESEPPYQYVANSPATYVDPSGTQSQPPQLTDQQAWQILARGKLYLEIQGELTNRRKHPMVAGPGSTYYEVELMAG